ncbi:hypothetical protein BRADI_2g09216v3 [Brachypodium distachyon]|uniref:Uncharacterized protein n=1 Tax=Brachypodium distachyon TaxID=15368 RepID=A0A0Q3MGU5_BRADI|nr:hypothetical protein BRADI_2g09216v3 [Brachypodium distachyon]
MHRRHTGTFQGDLSGKGGNGERKLVIAPLVTISLDEAHSGEQVGPGQAQVAQGFRIREVAEVGGEEADKAVQRPPRDGHTRGLVPAKRYLEDVFVVEVGEDLGEDQFLCLIVVVVVGSSHR